MTSGLELAANATATVCILLAGRNNVHTWWIGIVSCVLFILVFMQVRLYADAALQVFFIATAIIGWWQWLRGDHGRPLAVTRAARSTIVKLVPAGAIAALAYGALLHASTDAAVPYADSAVLAFSVIAQLLLMRRRVEAWPFWLLVNTIAVPVFASRGLYLTAALYAVYWAIALVSWRWWLRLAGEPGTLRNAPQA